MKRAELQCLFFLFPLALIFGGAGVFAKVEQKSWCVPKPSADNATLWENLNFACAEVDCLVLQKDQPCYYPFTMRSHASVAMNIYYQVNGRNNWTCDFKGSGLTVITDPSFDKCTYLFLA
ncbi:hypothetical protein J5N97_027737 [Dioscorea zingiberensis]|uniref:X8 domain-containing protein n=1 Tax=Dioscorea zingiberensis TaxID=325984 RepID=A0A9D5BXR7_9LILI|nr:hypothetical protein J5N97_027737 [Dioscorea zingiberensis]